MKKVLLFASVSVLLSACGGGGGDKDSASAQLTRGDLEITEKSLGSSRFGNRGGTMQGERSRTNAYDPDYTVNMDSAKVAGNSMMTFASDGTITLNSEVCVTNDNDCGAIRAAVLENGTVKRVRNGVTESVDAQGTLYSRDKVVISDNQKIGGPVAEIKLGELADTFDFYMINSHSSKLTSGDRSGLNGAKWVSISGDNRDAFHDPESTNYWTNSGVKESTGGKSRIIIIAIASKKDGNFAKYARLGIMAMSQTLSDGKEINVGFANIDGEYTTAAGLADRLALGERERGLAVYHKTKAWHAMGAINGQSAYMQGDVVIQIDMNTKKITQFNVENMTYQPATQASNVKTFLSGTKLQLANDTALSFGADGEYTGTLTENGGATGQNNKWDATLEGNFFGPKAEETAGAVIMEKNGHKKDNALVGGFAAEYTHKFTGRL